MKKTRLRVGALVLVACLMLACFSGCASMDDLKARHAVWGDEKQNSILWQGEEYVYLLQETYEGTPYTTLYDWSKTLYVTEPDVPTLLASSYGLYTQVSVNGNYLSCNSRVFCKADQYDALKAIVDSGLKTDRYGYIYYDNENGEQKLRTFTEAESELLDTIIDETLDGEQQKTPSENTWYLCEIQYCYVDTELIRYTELDLMQSENGYYLSYAVEVEQDEEELKELYGEDWEDIDWMTEEWITCPIPAEYNEQIEEWFAPVIESMDSDYIMTEDVSF